MSTDQDINNVKANITKSFEERKVKLFALSLSYAGQAINEFRKLQPGGQGEKGIWTNQTAQAYERMFAKAFQDKNSIGFFLSHGVQYGIYLELANDRKYEVIFPIMLKLGYLFKKDIEKELF